MLNVHAALLPPQPSMGHQRGEFAPFNDPVAVDIERLHDCSHLFRVGKHPQLSKDRCYLFAVNRAAAVDIKLPKSGSELLLLSRRE